MSCPNELSHYDSALRGIAYTLSQDPDEREDLLQEMRLHLWQAFSQNASHSRSYYLQSCRDAARNSLRCGKSNS